MVLSFYCVVPVVGDFASASTAYVTVKGVPSKVWNASAVPANGSEPALIGESVNFLIKDIATLPSPNGAFNGSAWDWFPSPPCVWLA